MIYSRDCKPGLLVQHQHLTLQTSGRMVKIPSSRCSEASPQHNPSTTMFNCGESVLWLVDLFLSPNISSVATAKDIYFYLIWPKDAFLVCSKSHFKQKDHKCPDMYTLFRFETGKQKQGKWGTQKRTFEHPLFHHMFKYKSICRGRLCYITGSSRRATEWKCGERFTVFQGK